MYEYTPKSEKKLEKLLFAGATVLAVLLFAGSQIPGIPYPIIFQVLSFAVFGFDIILISKYLITTYSYSVEPAENGERELKITQRTGKRLIVVCRIPLSSVTQSCVMTKENKKALRVARKNRMIYRYVEEICPARTLLLDVTYGGEDFTLLILSDSTLEEILINH